MYAIIAIGGKQLKVHEGDTIRVERLRGEVGDTVTLDEVLLVQKNDGASTLIGTPTVEGASVKGSIIGHGRDKKITIFKHKRRKNYRRKQGHRQQYTALKVTGIDVKEPAKPQKKSSAKAKKPKEKKSDPSAAED